MLLRDFLANMRRRWYLLVIGLLLTGVAATGAYMAAPASYQTKASLLLLPPKSSVGVRGNPFLYLGGLDQALDVLSTRLNAEEVTKPIAQKYPDLTLEIARDATTSGPILVIDATSSHAADTQTVVNQLVATVPNALSSLQDTLEIPSASRITSMNLNIDREPTIDLKTKIRALVAVGAAGLAGTILITGLIDSLLAGRRRRRPGTRVVEDAEFVRDEDDFPARPVKVEPGGSKEGKAGDDWDWELLNAGVTGGSESATAGSERRSTPDH